MYLFHSSSSNLSDWQDKMYLKRLLLTHRGLRLALRTSSNWCQRGQTAMIYSQDDLTGAKLLLPQLPLLQNSRWVHAIPSASATVTAFPTTHTPFSSLQVLVMFEWLGLCVSGLPCPLKRALINSYFINQEVLAGSKRLWGQDSAEVLNRFPNPPGLDIFSSLQPGNSSSFSHWGIMEQEG